MKLERNAFIQYLDTNFKTGTAAWGIIGKDIEEMSTEMNPDITTAKNILGENSVRHKGYEPSMDADPFFADPEDPIYPKLLDIAMNRKKGDSCKTQLLEVVIEDTEATAHKAWTEDVIVAPNSYGGDTEGFAIPFGVTYAGNRVAGYVTITNKVPTFTAGEMPEEP